MIDDKQRLVIAHVLHSRAMMTQAPISVMRALSEWISQLEGGAKGNTEHIGVSDSVEVSLVDVRKKEGMQ